ncbi:double-strand break repair protein AddB [Aliiroseovarius subalbicans]|uniref:double-strand break repair protein AddB n=1 Tax=Aliiroseovarius subalbicans TaxID=2925840 RepID=UPI001F5ACB8A|nr:double-strand break repair protein AddB [Aliiroseovarius subalbicans]MCI2400033.1 double-strand break repair protein AddB [Aliiroseovarius subalbicans]
MFDPAPSPRLFGLAPGVDFPAAVVRGLTDRFRDQPPEALARVELYVNTRRMQRRIRELFDAGPALLLPRIRLVTDLSGDLIAADIPPAVSPLRRRLELSQLIADLLDREPDLAPRAAIYDLADSLAGLMDEMQGEGVDPAAIHALDVSDQSGHWARSLAFVSIVERFFGEHSTEAPDTEARQRRVVERLVERWKHTPPDHPVIVAGSTGSRGATGLFMRAVAGLPQGALILPGFDFDLPCPVWSALDDAMASEDHPQYRFAHLMRGLNVRPEDVRPWTEDTAPNPARNRLLSLALRPAPVTDQWQTEGGAFDGIDQATDRMTLIEASSPRGEASAIALVLRKAVEDGRRAALITPDRTLTRQVTAALDRWRIEPDDSAGRPLPLTAPGRFLRHVAELFGQRLTAPALLTLLKHPLTNTGGDGRGDHLRWTRDLELELLRPGLPFPGPDDLTVWCEARHEDDAPRRDWALWIGELLCGHEDPGKRDLTDHLSEHLRIARALAAGPDDSGTGELWEKPAGQEALRVVTTLEREAEFGGRFTPSDYRDLFMAVLNSGEARDPVSPHPDVMIWGTLEARVQGADLVILAGLNDGIWPETPSADPWMNRKMRHDAGLLLPERRVGLSAHDFQQAIAADEVILTRAIRDAESETVPSRWVNRLTNLLGGMSDEGAAALTAMRARGRDWLDLAQVLDLPPIGTVPPANRPSPQPPVVARPDQLSVTRISKLIRDPYSIYAERILKLRPLDPLNHQPDAPLRGTILHHVLERFITERTDMGRAADRALLMQIADEVLATDAPWPATRALWKAKLARVADWFLDQEDARRSWSRNLANEVRARFTFQDIGFTLTGYADRIDKAHDGSLVIYDYKTGAPPSAEMQEHFDKQLLLEAVIAEAGGFEGLAPETVSSVAYIGLGSSPKEARVDLEPNNVREIADEFCALIRRYQDRDQGYTSRRAVYRMRFAGDHDHLARAGEWDDSQDPVPEEVGE